MPSTPKCTMRARFGGKITKCLDFPGQLLVSIEGLTYTTYMQDLPDQYRVVVGNQTLIFAKENDPTLLPAPSTGKLIKFLVSDGSHVDAGQPYCEIEVMKMITTLHVNEVRL